MDAKVLVSAQTIKKALPVPSGPFSIADISAKSGLSLRDAEVGLQYLTSEYRGHLAATSKGELVFEFPHGFQKPWEKTEAFERALSRLKKGVLGVAKFVVRAWISVVMIGYVVIFALILLALSTAKKSDSEDDREEGGSGGMMFAMLLRMITDSLFWTFHPFSPFHPGHQVGFKKKKNDLPFYEKVNRYFFGPEDKPVDPNALPRKMVELIRAKRGRIGITDVMKVTGLSPREADPLLARLMLDYDGEVSVSEEGSLVYTFKEIRKTVQNNYVPEPAPIWSTREKLKPLTGNAATTNALITMLNGFNLLMSSIAISQGWSVEKLLFILKGGSPFEGMQGVPLVLGWIPFVFSAVLFSLPLLRWLNKPKEKRAVDRENGRRGLFYAVLNSLTPRGLSERSLKAAWEKIAQAPANDKAVLREVVSLGGDVEIREDGAVVYRFKQIESELTALTHERKIAPEHEKDVGAVVFSSAT